jgi:hypothetical protein
VVSCKQKSKYNYENKIIGEWKFVREINQMKMWKNPPPPPFEIEKLVMNFIKW